MNNLNDPQDWNIMPERQGDGGGDSSKWNYALLVPMLGLAAFRWIWSKQFQKEIEDVKVKMQKDLDLERQECCNIKLECKALKYKIFRFHEALKKGKEQEQGALNALNEVQKLLMKRQKAFCSPFVYRSWREDEERELMAYTAKHPLAHLKMENDLIDIFNNDRSCAEYLNADPQKNGGLMWLYLRYWRQQLTLQTHQRAEAILGIQTKK
ncbi:coiled-coil domain-containing protein 127-like [Megalobrama amblycephala]|uniref:coiled-coil domain-containing protein 127-like n=1 Tax=Megalobrama amblycephala TaxID=75352 RepID=UPI002013E1CD|nr:coiled-coil domain-containing protein 127-like [Megalobrama amblycephala]